jgi:outer membrane protein TolC
MKAATLLAILGAGALGSALRAAEPAPLTLSRTIDAVLARYPTIAAAQAEIDAARGRTEESNADRLPQVSASGGYSYLSMRPYVAFGSASFFETSRNTYNGSVAVRQLLTDFGRTDSLVELSRSGEITAEDALTQAKSQLGYQAIADFYGVLLVRQSVGVAEEDIRALTEALRIAQRKYSAGTATKFDVLTTQVRLEAARDRLTDAIAARSRQEAGLRELLGDEPGSPIELDGDFPASAPPPPDLGATIAAGLENRPEMKLVRDAEATARIRAGVADRADRPEVAATASGGLQDGLLPDLYDNKGYVAAGVSVSIPIFTGKRTTGERVAAQAELRAAQARIREITQTVTADVETALTDLGAASERLGRADTQVEQAREALALAETRYAAGVITNFELLDAQSAARSAELARLQARYDCALARQAVARAAGQPPAP